MRTTVGFPPLRQICAGARQRRGGAAQGGRRHPGRQDQHGDAARRLPDRQSAVRPDQQSVECRAHAGRLQRRRGCGACRRDDAVRDRHGHAELDPPARAFLRRVRAEADREPRVAGRRLSQSRRCATHHPHHELHRADGAQRRGSGAALPDHRRAGRAATPICSRCRSTTCQSSTQSDCASPMRRHFRDFRSPPTSAQAVEDAGEEAERRRRDRRRGGAAGAGFPCRSGGRR